MRYYASSKMDRVIRFPAFFLIGLVLVGCPQTATPVSPEAKAKCESKLTDLKAWMSQLASEGAGLGSDLTPPVVDRKANRVSSSQFGGAPILLEISNQGVEFEGHRAHKFADRTFYPLSTTKKVADALKAKASLAAKLGTKLKDIAILVDATTPWSKVVAITDSLVEIKLARIQWIFSVKEALRPPSSSLFPKLGKKQKVDVSKRAPVLAKQSPKIKQLFAQCSQAQQAFEKAAGELKAQESEKRIVALTDAVTEPLKQCACKDDLTHFKAAMWFQLRSHHAIGRHGINMTLASEGDADAQTITMPASTPWSEAHKKILAASGGGAFHLASQP